MEPLLLAHGPILGVIAFECGVVALASLVVALLVWWLSAQPRLSSPTGCVAPIVIGLGAVLVSVGATILWLITGWTIAGRVGGDASQWSRRGLAVLPSALVGAVYVWHRRARVRFRRG